MTLYIVRHGETEGNLGKFHQTDETPLNDTGLSQAKQVAKRFAHTPIDVIIASPTVRTRQTAKEIAHRTQAPVVFEEKIKEKRNPSVIHHMPHSQSGKIWEKIFAHFDDPQYHYDDEENAWDFIKRISESFASLEKRSEDCVVVVTHGFVIRAIVGLITFGNSFSPREFRHMIDHFATNNTGITMAEYSPDSGWRVITVNDHAHLLE